jgi:hypothetical protein
VTAVGLSESLVVEYPMGVRERDEALVVSWPRAVDLDRTLAL